MRQKLIIHCGAHKTATSSLQYFFSKNHQWLLDSGVRYIEPSALNEAKIPEFLRRRRKLSPEEIAQGAEALSIATSDRNVDAFLISHESFFSYAGNPTDGPIYPTLEKGLKTFRKFSCPLETRFLFCVREPAAFAESVFLQNLGIVHSGTFEQFFKGIDLKNLDWVPVLRALSENSGLGATRFFPYEVLKKRGSREFLQLVLSSIGIDKDAPAPLPFVNRSLSGPASKKLQSMGPELRALSPGERRNLRKEIEEEFKETPTSRHSELSPEQKEMVSKSLSKRNQEVFRIYLPQFDPGLWDQ